MKNSRFVSEPFRIFFVFGFLASLAGVGMWPLYHWGVVERVSGVLHARLQIEAFLGCFAVGFLLTAIPRMLEVKSCSFSELIVVSLLFTATVLGHALERPFFGDAAFLGVLVFVLVFAARRFFSRKDLPPPFFIFVPIGFLHAITGCVLLLLAESGRAGAWALMTGKAFLNVGFLLCLVLGIGSFLGPRFFGFLQGMPTTGSPTPSPLWLKRAGVFLIVGLGMYASFWTEDGPWQRYAEFFRALAATLVLAFQAGITKPPRAPGFLPQVMRLSMVLTAIGLWMIPLWPAHRVASSHILFIGGFSLITFVVSTRVSLGHSGFEHLFERRMAFIGVLAILVTAAMFIRATADFHSDAYFLVLAIASLCWIAGGAIWAWMILPKIFFPRPEENDQE